MQSKEELLKAQFRHGCSTSSKVDIYLDIQEGKLPLSISCNIPGKAQGTHPRLFEVLRETERVLPDPYLFEWNSTEQESKYNVLVGTENVLYEPGGELTFWAKKVVEDFEKFSNPMRELTST